MSDTIDTYVTNCVRTESQFDPSVRERLNKSLFRCLHAALGVSGEMGELGELLNKIDNMTHIKDFMKNKQDIITNLREEIGDICWYIALACHELNINFEEIINDCFENRAHEEYKYEGLYKSLPANDDLSDEAFRQFRFKDNLDFLIKECNCGIGKMIDQTKRALYYGKELDLNGKYKDGLKEVVRAIVGFVDLKKENELSLESILTANVAKLEARYKKNKFEKEAALNRDLDAEKIALEKK